MPHLFHRKRKTRTARKRRVLFCLLGVCLCIALTYLVGYTNLFSVEYNSAAVLANGESKNPPTPPPVLDKVAYDKKLLAIANYPIIPIATSTATTTKAALASSTPSHLWPVKTVYPNAGAILPFSRIVAYYGNFLSTSMGVLGQYPPEVMLQKLASTSAQWQAADPSTPVIPAIDYIAVTAQGSPGADGKYRLRMPDTEIQHAIDLAAQVHGLVFLEVQLGLSTVQAEIPLLEPYLKLPQVELAIDPEFAMKTSGRAPGTVIGTVDATDVNYTIDYLSQLVRENNLPPKILVVHRFTEEMVTNYKEIEPTPEVQFVMDMDGWGFPAKKIATYNEVVYPEPVQFTGFKLFYKNDLLPPSTVMLTPAQILKLKPQPVYIQYQ